MYENEQNVVYYNARMSKLKSLRIEKTLHNKNNQDLMGISLRSYKSYENDEEKIGTLKYNYIIEK